MGSDMMHYGNQGGSLQRSMDLEVNISLAITQFRSLNCTFVYLKQMGQPQKSRKVKDEPKLITNEMYAHV